MAVEQMQPCPHVAGENGRCALCGACLHEVILNGACLECGARDIEKTIKPVEKMVPAGRLRARKAKR